MGHLPPREPLRSASDAEPHLKVVLATLVFFLGTLYVVLRWGMEPYPALIMPDFPGPGAALHAHVELETLDIVVHLDGSPPQVATVPDFFRPFPESAHFALVAHFRPRSPQTDSSSGEHLLPGWRIRQARLAQPPYSQEVRAWLRQRAQELFPRSRASMIQFRWYRDEIDNLGQATGNRRLIDTVAVPFDSRCPPERR